MKYRLEGFYYGLLADSFFSFMDWKQYGHITHGTIFADITIPLFAAWILGNSLKENK